jgi:type VI secretion system protein ImpC
MADETNTVNALVSTTDSEKPLVERIVQAGNMARSEEQESYARQMIVEYIRSVAPAMKANGDGDGAVPPVGHAIQQTVASFDEKLTGQLDEILHDPQVQRLEASWRGLAHLVFQTETSTRLKLRLLNITKQELSNDLEKAIEFDQSALFKKVYEEEYGTFGGNPYSMLLGDYEFDWRPPDVALLERLSNVAAAAHAPFIAASSPALFDMDSFTQLQVPRDLAKIFENLQWVKWQSFRNSEDSRYVVLTLPHVLLRLPYGPDTKPVEGLNYSEGVDGKDHSKYLWGNSAYFLAERITNAFAHYSWCAAIRGVEGGGIVEGLPAHTFQTDEGDIALKCPTETAITDRREKELDELGFIALLHCKNTDYAAFFGGHTVNRPKVYNTNEANANARLSAMLPYMLAASRFAHYIKVMMRDKIGSFMSRINVEQYLNTWLSDYILLSDEATQSEKARFPLREGRIDVTEVPGRPGSYRATVFLRPHFQLEELTASIRLVAELPPPAAA